MKALLIDNYDSFTYNLAQALGKLGCDLTVKRNDALSLDDVRKMDPDLIIISPGPCTPSEAGISVPLVERYTGEYPIFGVCLGHQSIVQALGGRIVLAGKAVHGKTSQILHTGKGLFSGIDNPMPAGRYHSLAAESSSLPRCLEVTARAADDGTIMAVSHKEHQTTGVQFHPESILTRQGEELLKNLVDGLR